jgi:predicted phosphodiesterase
VRLRVYSDLHFEVHADLGKSFVDSLDPDGCDVVVLAGDIAANHCLHFALDMFCKKFPRVVHVPGNHEYYGANRGRVNQTLRRVKAKHFDRLTLLNRGIFGWMGKRILGTTMWFRKTEEAAQVLSTWSDSSAIQGFSGWVGEENRLSVNFLRQELREGDVVVTHYAPSWQSVHPRFAGEKSNLLYVCDMEELILERKPALWIHGHTHHAFDYRIGDTRVVCHPFGYPSEYSVNYNDAFTVEV